MIKLEKFDISEYDRLINWVDSEELMILFGGPFFKFPITHNQLGKRIMKI